MGLLDKLTKDKLEQKNFKTIGTSQIFTTIATSFNSGPFAQTVLMRLGFSNAQLALVGVPGSIVSMVMNLFSSFFVDKLVNKVKWWSIFYLCTMIAPLTGMIICIGPDFLRQTKVAFYVFAVFNSFSIFFTVLSAVIQYSVFSKALHNNIRGRFVGIFGIIGGLISMGGGIASSFILKHGEFPLAFGAIYFTACIFMAISALFIRRVKELPEFETLVIPKQVSPFANFRNVVKMREFRILMPANILRGFGDGAGGFAFVVALKQLGLDAGYAGYTATAIAFSGLIATAIVGFCSDKFGAGKLIPIIEIVLVGGLMGMVLAPAAWIFLSFYVIWCIMQVMEANAIYLVHFDVVPPEVMGTFTGLRMFILNLLITGSSVVVGFTLDHFSPLFIFSICGTLKLIAGILYYNSIRLMGRSAAKA